MKKKTLSLALALALCLGLTVPALAADTLSGSQIYPGNWDSGPSLTLTGVVGEVGTPIDPSYIYDVEVGGSLVLEMTYPAGKNRSYSIMIGGFYITPDFEPPDDDDTAAWDALGATWDLSESVEGGDFDESSGQTRFVYTFTESDMGQKNGLDKIIYPHIYWCDDTNGDGMVDEGGDGSAYFGVRVVPAKSSAPTVTVENIPASGTSYASTQTVTVDGRPVEFQMYALKDASGNGTNYIKLRDLAYVLNGTKAQFNVGYDGTVSVTTKTAYKAAGTEMSTPFSGDRTYSGGALSVKVDGTAVDMTAITLLDDAGGGYNYFKLRDLGKVLGFNVGWSAEQGVSIQTDEPYAG